jgi:hypothetical protein
MESAQRGSGSGNFEVKSQRKAYTKPSLSDFEQILKENPRIDEKLQQRVMEYQAHRLGALSERRLKTLGFDDDDVRRLKDAKIDPEFDFSVFLLPKWIRDFLLEYWKSTQGSYKINFENQSGWSHEYVVAFETHSGLIDVVETLVAPWSIGFVTTAPCFDMRSYAWSAWNPDDNVEVTRTRTYTVDEINAAESIRRPCEDTWEVRITYS